MRNHPTHGVACAGVADRDAISRGSLQPEQRTECIRGGIDVRQETPAAPQIATAHNSQSSDRRCDALATSSPISHYAVLIRKAEDLTQEAFLQVFRKLHTFRGDSGFSTWLHRICQGRFHEIQEKDLARDVR